MKRSGTENTVTGTEHLRALCLLVALLAHAIYALPIPPAIKEGQLSQPWRQKEIAAWQSALGAVGIDLSTEQIGSALVATTGAFAGLHRTLKAPFKPVFDLVGANQAWALFASVSTNPERLIIEVAGEDGEYRVVLRRLDPCCTWMEDPLRYRRLRGVWDSQRGGMRPAYRGLTQWIADRAFEDFPDAKTVRVSVQRGVATYPWEPDDPTQRVSHIRTHKRDERR